MALLKARMEFVMDEYWKASEEAEDWGDGTVQKAEVVQKEARQKPKLSSQMPMSGGVKDLWDRDMMAKKDASRRTHLQDTRPLEMECRDQGRSRGGKTELRHFSPTLVDLDMLGENVSKAKGDLIQLQLMDTL